MTRDRGYWLKLRVFMAAPLAFTAAAGELPVPCAPCTPAVGGPVGWITSGTATATSDASRMTITAGTQIQPNVTLNWQSFNVSPGNSVQFVQPSSAAIALNKIYQGDPSRIYGNLSANGQIYLINQNGIIFGSPDGTPMQVNVHGLVASSLAISDDAVANGILSPIQSNAAAFSGTTGFVQVNSGATLRTDDGGRIALFAPVVENHGAIETPDGQALLAAGGKIYLQSSDDPNLRGLLVEVDTGGAVTNTGSILATEGNITLLGLAVNQQGRVTATTSVTKAGSVRLLARDSVTFAINAGRHTAVAQHTGTVDFTDGSVTEVALDTSGATAVDDQPQPISNIEIDGKTIQLESGSAIHATGGSLALTAETDPSKRSNDSAAVTVQPRNDAVSIVMEAGSTVDVSGGETTVDMSRNQVTAQLRGNELADSPLQRDGILRGKTVTVDARADDGKGTPLANISGYLAATQRDVAERLGNGGTVNISSEGSVDLAPGSLINVSGGAVQYTSGFIATTKLVSNGKVYDIGSAPPDIVYDAIIEPQLVVQDTKWGVQQTFSSMAYNTYQPGYVEGKSAGAVQIAGRTLQLAGDILARLRIVDDGMARRTGIACATMSSGEDGEMGRSTTRCSRPSSNRTTRSRRETPRKSPSR